MFVFLESVVTPSLSLVLRIIRKVINSNSEVIIPADVKWTEVIDFSMKQGDFLKIGGNVELFIRKDYSPNSLVVAMLI